METMKENIIKNKSYQFAKEVVLCCQSLIANREFVISRQLMRSGTAVGALVREAEMAESKKDFIHKMSIALKEANETLYWLDLLHDTELLDKKDYLRLHPSSVELVKILISIVKSSKSQ